MLAHRRRRWPSVTSVVGQCIVLSGVSGAEIEGISQKTRYNHPVLFQFRASVIDDWPALNQQWAATLAQNCAGIWWVGLHPLYEVHRGKVLNECWPAPAMVVEGIHVEDIFYLVSSVLSLIISWTFSILHGPWGRPTLLCLENIKPIFRLSHSNRLKPGLEVRELLF